MNGRDVEIQILSLEEAGQVLSENPSGVDHLVSLGRMGSPLPQGWDNLPSEVKLRMTFEDLADPLDSCSPTKGHVHVLLDFLQARGPEGNWLFHCRMGISRSAACAAVVLAASFPNRAPEEVFQRILDVRPKAKPNELIVAYADEILGYGGALIEGARLCR